MNSILLRSAPSDSAESRAPKGRILAIEPDADRAAFVREVIQGSRDIELEIVARIDDAVRSITERLPDVVMTSTFFPPADEAALSAHLRKTRGASHVQIICVPHVGGTEAAQGPSGPSHPNVVSFVKRGPAANWPFCDLAVVREQIEDYLFQAVRDREDTSAMPPDGIETAPATSSIVATAAATVVAEWATREETEQCPAGERIHDRDRRRHRRLRGNELPSLWTVKLPWGSAAKVVDISKGGALIESGSKVVPGSILDLQLLGAGTNLSVPARMVRAEVARIDAVGVRYNIGAAFSRELDLVPLEMSSGSALSPRILIDLLSRVLEDEGAACQYFTLRSRFESELRRLLRVRDIRIRETPMFTDRGFESIYFSVPQNVGSPRILQVVFEPGVTPSASEFRLLRAAAGLAGVLMQFAPATDAFVTAGR
jgi:hypothetical protein